VEKEAVKELKQVPALLRSFGHRSIAGMLRAMATEPLYHWALPEKAKEDLLAAADEETKTANEIMEQARLASSQPESKEGE